MFPCILQRPVVTNIQRIPPTAFFHVNLQEAFSHGRDEVAIIVSKNFLCNQMMFSPACCSAVSMTLVMKHTDGVQRR